MTTKIAIKITFIIFSLLMSLFPAHSQNKHNNSLLWKVEGKNLDKPSYLFGTIHLLCPEDLLVSESVKTALKNTEQLVLEIDLDDPTVMQKIQRSMIYTDGTTARNYLDNEEYAMVATFFNDSLGMPFEQMQVIKPFYLSSMTIMHFLGCQPASWETELIKLATADQKETIGIERVEDQTGIIEALPLHIKKTMLLETITEYAKTKMMFEQMILKYKEQDIDALQKMVEEYMSDDYAHFERDLIEKRNKNWIGKIEENASSKPSFFAFGAGHLAGKKGVINLLRKAGYIVSPVR